MPSKKLVEVRPETLKNKLNDTSFAEGCNRSRIELCLDVGMEVEEFLFISLNALKHIADTLYEQPDIYNAFAYPENQDAIESYISDKNAKSILNSIRPAYSPDTNQSF